MVPPLAQNDDSPSLPPSLPPSSLRLHTTEADAAVASHALKEVKGQLSKAQQECKDKDEKIQRLEKRLLFVTKVWVWSFDWCLISCDLPRSEKVV